MSCTIENNSQYSEKSCINSSSFVHKYNVDSFHALNIYYAPRLFRYHRYDEYDNDEDDYDYMCKEEEHIFNLPLESKNMNENNFYIKKEGKSKDMYLRDLKKIKKYNYKQQQLALSLGSPVKYPVKSIYNKLRKRELINRFENQ